MFTDKNKSSHNQFDIYKDQILLQRTCFFSNISKFAKKVLLRNTKGLWRTHSMRNTEHCTITQLSPPNRASFQKSLHNKHLWTIVGVASLKFDCTLQRLWKHSFIIVWKESKIKNAHGAKMFYGSMCWGQFSPFKSINLIKMEKIRLRDMMTAARLWPVIFHLLTYHTFLTF